MAANALKKEFILFPNNNEAVAVFPAATRKAEDIVAALQLDSYKAVILLIGGAGSVDEKLLPRLTQLFGRGIARAAVEADAVIIDGGTQAGVMALMGEGVAGRGHKSTLIGVVPIAKVTYPGSQSAGVQLEPNHTHFVLVEGQEWGSETATMFNLAGALIGKTTGAVSPERKPRQQDSDRNKVSALAILASGGTVSRNEVLRAVRQSLPLIVVEGSGGLADEIAAAWKERETLPDDPVMAEIIADGEVHLHPLSSSVKGIERLIIRELGVDKVLTQAWEVFADYDHNAKLQQGRFDKLQLAILIIGVIGTALAISQEVFAPRDTTGNLVPAAFPAGGGIRAVLTAEFGWWAARQLLIITPILLTVLITAANRFKQGNKWLLLRAGAESIKREIYRYRTRAMNYKEQPEQQLSKMVENITRRTMRTEVNLTGLVPYHKDKGFPPYMYAAQGGDDGFSYLTPDRYVEVRLADQLNFFQKKSVKLERQLKVLYWLTFIIGGVGTYLAATGRQVWIALTTALLAAIGTYLGYRQTESTLTKYNQAATDLANVKAWWNALSAEEQAQQENIDSLVRHTEQVLQSELDGWVQQMQNALAELRRGQEAAADEDEENREPQESTPPTTPKPPADQREAGDAAAGAEDNEETAPTDDTSAAPSATGADDEDDASTLDETPEQPGGGADDSAATSHEDESAGADANADTAAPLTGRDER